MSTVGTSTIRVANRTDTVRTRLFDYLELTKPRIVALELIVAGAAACVAMPHGLILSPMLYALLGTALVASSASIANQWIERDADSKMPRTANRPLPAGRVTSFEALMFAGAGLVLGMSCLVLMVNALTAALGLLSWVIYVLIYTPLKSRTPLNTVVGAVAGAIPILMGWTATGAGLNLTAVSLAAVLFLWQFPHFMAIAWLYRRDYALAGHQMLSVADPSGLRAGAQAVVSALMLIPVSLVPALSPTSGSPVVYLLWALVLGIAQLLYSILFFAHRDETSARRLLRATLLYLPAWMVVLLMVSL